MAQETAIDFLLEKMSNLDVIYAEGKVLKELNDSIKKAKAMEKEQIVNAHLFGLLRPLEMEATKQAEQYYNETYKK